MAGATAIASLEFEHRDVALDRTEAEFDTGMRHLADAEWGFPEGVVFDAATRSADEGEMT